MHAKLLIIFLFAFVVIIVVVVVVDVVVRCCCIFFVLLLLLVVVVNVVILKVVNKSLSKVLNISNHNLRSFDARGGLVEQEGDQSYNSKIEKKQVLR